MGVYQKPIPQTFGDLVHWECGYSCTDLMHVAPELFKHRGLENTPFRATFEADMYAFGCILFQLIRRESIMPKVEHRKRMCFMQI